MKTKIATAPTIERLTALINQFYYSTTCYIKEGKAFNSKGEIPHSLIESKKNKYTYYLQP